MDIAARRLGLKAICYNRFKDGIQRIHSEDPLSSFEKKKRQQDMLVARWKQTRRKRSDLTFEQFKQHYDANKQKQISKKEFFLKFDCKESFPSWLFFLPDMKQTYRKSEKFDSVIIQKGNDLDAKINFVIEADNGIAFEYVFESYIVNRPRIYLQAQVSRERKELYQFYYKCLNGFGEAKRKLEQVDQLLKTDHPMVDSIAFEESQELQFVHTIKIKRLADLVKTMKELDSVIERRKFEAKTEWFNFMNAHMEQLRKTPVVII